MVYEKYFVYLVFSAILSLVWMVFSKDMYNYNRRFPKIFGICIYPLFAWMMGLFTLALIYDLFLTMFSKTLTIIILVPLYCILLIFVEYIFYHKFSVHNVAAAKYPPLPFINALHAPLWMKIAYFALGMIMIALLAIFY